MIRVLVIDDSPLARKLIGQMLESDPEIEVIDTAMNGVFGLRKIYRDKPDVVTLDFEMPQMDGLETLEAIMDKRPTPVIMLSSYTQSGVELTMRALALGAVDFVAKPDGRESSVLGGLKDELIDKVKTAARASVHLAHPEATEEEREEESPGPAPRHAVSPKAVAKARRRTQRGEIGLIAIGASTGGVPGVERILSALPADAPPAVVVQHMPRAFTSSFAARLDARSTISVAEAHGGEVLGQGMALVARGDSHLGVNMVAGRLVAEVSDGEKVSGHRPSVDFLFQSCSSLVGVQCLGVILTGMGRDGAQGLLRILDAGGRTIAESEESAVIFGMPGEAIRMGGAEFVLDSEDMPAKVLQLLAVNGGA